MKNALQPQKASTRDSVPHDSARLHRGTAGFTGQYDNRNNNRLAVVPRSGVETTDSMSLARGRMSPSMPESQNLNSALNPSRFSHDFSRVRPHAPSPKLTLNLSSMLSKRHSSGRGFLADEEKSEQVPHTESIGVGEDAAVPADAAPADAGPPTPDAGPGDAAPPAEVPPVAAAPCAITSEATAHAPDKTADTRTTIGVCETIVFSVGGQLANWSADSGWPSARIGRASFEWAAPEQPGTSKITATIPATGQTCTLDMTVVAPSDITMRRTNVLAYAAGSAGAGMQLEVRVQPRNVNFGWVSFLEDPGPATGVTGYFAAFGAAALAHVPNPDFVRFSFNNTFRFDTAATVAGALAPPWAPGSWTWRIPNRYRCFNSTGTGTGFTTTVQRFTITATGAVTVTKEGASVTRNP